jgi:hypothetical protein
VIGLRTSPNGIFPPCVTLTNTEKVNIIHDKQEPKQFLEDSKGFLPEPTGIDVESPVNPDDEEWWQSIDVANLSPERASQLLAVIC